MRSADTGAYRNTEELARARRDAAIARWHEALATLDPRLAAIFARRIARMTAGLVMVSGFGAMAIASFAGGGPTHVLVATWVLAFSVYLVTRVAVASHVAHALVAAARPTLDPWDDAERLENDSPAQYLSRIAGRAEADSAAWPLVGVVLLLPLTMHLGLDVLLGSTDSGSFDRWIVLSLVLVGHCHLIVARRAWRFGRTLGPLEGWRALGAALVWSPLSTVTGLGFLGFPAGAWLTIPIGVAVVVGLTGMLAVPAAFGRMRNRVHAEREILG